MKLNIFLLTTLLVVLTISSNMAAAATLKRQTSKSKLRADEDITVVSTTLGQVRGQIFESRGGHNYVGFLGIPFAEKPERFEVAEPKKPWTGVRDAVQPGEKCPQIYLPAAAVIGSEDCLFVNVFYPHPDRCTNDTKLPVLTLIHGGAFVEGSGDLYEPKYLLDECIVYVTFNYRLGALGFLTTGDGVISGNIGLKDQLLAMRWIKANAENFRGDSNLITLMGFSAGAGSVSSHISSPQSRGLFQRAIVMSGSGEAPWSVVKTPCKRANILGNILNCSTESTTELKRCLKTADLTTLVMNQEAQKKWVQGFMEIIYGPVLEQEVENADSLPENHRPFQTQHPNLSLRSGNFSRVPLMIGATKDEGHLLQAGAIIQNHQAIQDLNDDWNRYSPITFYYDELGLNKTESDKLSEKIRAFYFGNKRIGNETYQELVNLCSDRFFNQGVFLEADLHSKYAPVFPYVFTYQGPFSYAQIVLGFQKPVVTHLDDTQYLFKVAFVPEQAPGSEAEKVSQNLVKLYTSFAKNGEPSTFGINEVEWKPHNSNGPRVTFKIDMPPENIVNYLEPRKQFWEEIQAGFAVPS